MHSKPTTSGDAFGDLDALFAQLDTPNEAVDVVHGYAALLARVASPAYRRGCGLVSH